MCGYAITISEMRDHEFKGEEGVYGRVGKEARERRNVVIKL